MGPPDPPQRGIAHPRGERTGRHWMAPDPDLADVPWQDTLRQAAWLVVWIFLVVLVVGFMFGQWQ